MNLAAYADLLKNPIVTDGGDCTFNLKDSSQVALLDVKTGMRAFGAGRVELVGEGNHCRWMLTESELIILMNDGTFHSKKRPVWLPFSAAAAYSSTFLVNCQKSDILILSGGGKCAVINISPDCFEEMVYEARALFFTGSEIDGEIFLYGQSLRQGPIRGVPVAAKLTSGWEFLHINTLTFPKVIPCIEAVVGIVADDDDRIFVCSSAPAMETIDDLEIEDIPFRVDTANFYLIRQVEKDYVIFGELSNCLFVGESRNKSVYFQKYFSSKNAELIILDSLGVLKSSIVENLSNRSIVRNLSFNSTAGWIGLAEVFEDRSIRMLHSEDGSSWVASSIVFAGD